MDFMKRRLSKHAAYGLSFTLCILASIALLILFVSLTEDVIGHDRITQVDLRVMHFFASGRTTETADMMLFFTYFGNWQFIVSFLFIVVMALILLRKYRIALFLVAGTVIGEILSSLLKYLVRRPRPDPLYSLISQQGYSFPSGHALIAPIVWGLLGFFLYRHMRGHAAKFTVAAATIAFVFIIGISRIYLGVHWTSDVLAGWVLGFAIVVPLIALFNQRERWNPQAQRFPMFPRVIMLALAGILLVVESIYFAAIFHGQNLNTPLSPYSPTIRANGYATLEALAADERFPKYSELITGERWSPVSIIVAGSKETLVRAFESAGWFVAEPLKAKTTYNVIRTAILQGSYPTAPVSPSFVNSFPETIAFQQPTAINKLKKRHHTRFWPSGFSFNDQMVWVATASFDNGYRYVTHSIDPNIDAERDYIKHALERTGMVKSVVEFQLVPPYSGKTFIGNSFFTDGKAYAITFAE